MITSHTSDVISSDVIGTAVRLTAAWARVEFEAYVPSNCPPAVTEVGPKTLYRLVRSNPITADDFRTTYEEGKHHEGDACLRCAISTHSTREGAAHLRASVTYFRDHLISMGSVPESAGRLKQTGRAPHYSWWPVRGIARHSYFRIVT